MNSTLEFDRPYLSIIIPVFNGEKYISDTLESLSSLKDMAACDLEIIFQNGLSTDNTSEIIDSFCSNRAYAYHYNEKDVGQSDAINKGVSRARGEWVTWLNADDILLPNLWKALGEADGDQADIVYGDVLFVMDNQSMPAIGTETHLVGKLAKNRLIIQQAGTCIRRSAWQECGGVNPKLIWMMDYDLFLRLESMNRKFYRSKEFVAAALIHKDAKTSSGSIKRLLEIWSVIYRSHLKQPRYLRLKPYYVYLIEYIIKNIESREVKPRFLFKFLLKLHRLFWIVSVPDEKNDIEKRFRSLPPEITEFTFKAVRP